jgi:hypothetical protein
VSKVPETGYFDSPYLALELRYPRHELPDPLPACCATSELFGRTRLEHDEIGRIPTIARPRLLVTGAVRERLAQLRLGRLGYAPAAIVD